MTEKEEVETQQTEQTETSDIEMAAPTDTAMPMDGPRARRSTQKFGFDDHKPEEEEEEFKPPVGSGVKVRDMEAVAEKIAHMGKKDAETIKSLYSIMYNRRFQQKNIRSIKEHILDFTGIPDVDDKTRQQLEGKMGRWMRSYVQDIMDVLGVDRSKKSFDEENKPFDKDALIHRLIEWLSNPQEPKNAKRKAAASTPKKKKTAPAAKATKATAGTKRKSAATTKKPAKKAKTATKKTKAEVEEADEEDEATESEVDKAEEAGAGDSDSDFDEENTKSKKTKRAPKKAAPRRGKKASAAVESDGENEAEEETDAKEENKLEETTDALAEDVQEKVKDIIAHGDAEQLTVKKIVRQLSEDMGKDFSGQKHAIKDFVANLEM